MILIFQHFGVYALLQSILSGFVTWNIRCRAGLQSMEAQKLLSSVQNLQFLLNKILTGMVMQSLALKVSFMFLSRVKCKIHYNPVPPRTKSNCFVSWLSFGWKGQDLLDNSKGAPEWVLFPEMFGHLSNSVENIHNGIISNRKHFYNTRNIYLNRTR